MGLIKSIFGAIFGLIGGIFKAIGGLVGLGKKSEFFMELDEASSVSEPAAAPTVEAPAAGQTSPAPAAKAPAKAVTKKAPAKENEAPSPVVAVAAEPAPINFATTYLNGAGSTLPRRRRPGPSLSPFRDMAKQVKVR